MLKSIIVAASENDVIGKEGGLPWYLPAELARFKQITMSHPIIMGRVTHESIGRALPGRKNIVISRSKEFRAGECLVVPSLESAILASEPAKEVFIIGGSSVYEQSLPLVDKIYLTRVHTKIDGDKFFKFDQRDWKMVSSEKHQKNEKNPHDFEFQVWVRK